MLRKESDQGVPDRLLDNFGQDGGEVDAAIMLRIVHRIFLVHGDKMMDFPALRPSGFIKNSATKNSHRYGNDRREFFQNTG